MVMTPEEIVRDYKQAKAPTRHIQLLADLNQCDKGSIIKILTEAGVKLPGNMGPRKKPDAEKAPEEPGDQTGGAPAGKMGTITVREAVQLAREAALNAIEQAMPEELSEEEAIHFTEQVRTIIALARQMERAAGRMEGR